MMMRIEGEDKVLKNIQKARELLDQAEKLLWETKGAFKMKIEPSPDCSEDGPEKATDYSQDNR